jgi:uncharacterized protein YjiS (DUF1127 family)
MMERRTLSLAEISSGLARQSESLINIRRSLKRLDRLTESERARSALRELSGEMEIGEGAVQDLIADGIISQTWGELTHSANSVVELGEELKKVVEKLEREKENRLPLIKELL